MSETGHEPERTALRSGRRAAVLLERYGGVIVLLAMIAVFSFLEPVNFPTYENAVGILGSYAISGIVALGLLAPLAAGVFDLSIAGVMTLSVVGVTALFQSTHGKFPVVLAVLCVLVGAIVVGMINGFLVLKIEVDPFIATIGTSAVLVGMSQLIANGTTIVNNIPASFTNFGQANVGKIPVLVFVFAGLALITWYLMTHTPFGPSLYATGAAREATRLAGIRTTRIIVLGFCSSALGAAIAGVLFAAQSGSGPPSVGDGYLLGAYAAAFLGSTMIRPGRFNVGGLIVALLIVGVGVNGLQQVGLPFWVIETFQGSALLLAVALGKLGRRTTSAAHA
ncbi:MAG: ABC transporter permease [Nocardioides sp.]